MLNLSVNLNFCDTQSIFRSGTVASDPNQNKRQDPDPDEDDWDPPHCLCRLYSFQLLSSDIEYFYSVLL